MSNKHKGTLSRQAPLCSSRVTLPLGRCSWPQNLQVLLLILPGAGVVPPQLSVKAQSLGTDRLDRWWLIRRVARPSWW